MKGAAGNEWKRSGGKQSAPGPEELRGKRVSKKRTKSVGQVRDTVPERVVAQSVLQGAHVSYLAERPRSWQ